MKSVAWIVACSALGALLIGCGDDTTPQETPSETVIQGLDVERLDDDSVRIRWTPVEGEVQIRQATAAAEARAGEVVMEMRGGAEAVINSLDPAHRWYFAVNVDGGPARVTAERRVSLTGALNFRDVGGYDAEGGKHVRWGAAFRSDALANLTLEDQALLADMGVRTIVDLRTALEVQHAPDKPIAGSTRVEAEVVLGLNPDEVCASQEPVATLIDGFYQQIVDDNAALFADLALRYGDVSQSQLVTHCTGGKDRTGIAMGLLLSLVGVPDDQVLEDYALSELYLQEAMAAQRDVLVGLGCSEERADEILAVNPGNLASTLDHVRSTYGSVEAYFKDGGLDDAEIARLEAVLLE